MEDLELHHVITLVLAFAAIIFLMFFGKTAFSVFKFIDRGITAILFPFAWLSRATFRPRSTSQKWFRRLYLCIYFGVPLAIITVAVVRASNVSFELPEIPGWVLISSVALLYLTSLSIAKQWLSHESDLFDLEDCRADRRAGVISNHLKAAAIISIFVLMLCVPASFFVQLDDPIIAVESAMDLMVSTLDIPIGADNQEDNIWSFVHVIVFTYIVIEAFVMIARADYARKLALNALMIERNTDKVVPFGERVAHDLAVLLTHQKKPFNASQDDRSSTEKNRNSSDAAKALGIIAVLDSDLTEQIVDQLERVALGANSRAESVRKVCIDSLCQIALHLQKNGSEDSMVESIIDRIKIVAFEKEVGTGLCSRALIAIRDLKGLSDQKEMNLVGELIKANDNKELRRAGLTCLAAHSEVPYRNNAQFIGILKLMLALEPDSHMRTLVGETLSALAPELFESDVLDLCNNLTNSPDANIRSHAALHLGSQIENDLARNTLVNAHDDSEQVQCAIIRGLGNGSELTAQAWRYDIIKALADYLDPKIQRVIQNCAIKSLSKFHDDARVKRMLLRHLANDKLSAISVIGETTRALAELNGTDELVSALRISTFEVHSQVQQALRSLLRRKYAEHPELIEKIEDILNGLDAGSTTREDQKALREAIEDADNSVTQPEPDPEPV